jgi:hypothetical protein
VRALHPFYLTAWVFLLDPAVAGHRISAPVCPVTISQAIKSVNQNSMSAVNRRHGLGHTEALRFGGYRFKIQREASSQFSTEAPVPWKCSRLAVTITAP